VGRQNSNQTESRSLQRKTVAEQRGVRRETPPEETVRENDGGSAAGLFFFYERTSTGRAHAEYVEEIRRHLSDFHLLGMIAGEGACADPDGRQPGERAIAPFDFAEDR